MLSIRTHENLRRAAAALGVVALTAFSLSAQESPPADPGADLRDAEIAHIAVTANNIDIDLARLAESRTQHADVRAFAATMIRDHSATLQRASELMTRLGVVPVRNAISETLTRGATDAQNRLAPLHGRDFDRAYIEREVQFHESVLEAVERIMLPTTENAELKRLLEEMVPSLTSHRDHAKQILASLGGSGRQ
jgi:putative membrane protein